MTYASTDDFWAEMIARKVFCSRSNMLKKKSDEKQNLTNNENKELTNSLIDQIDLLKWTMQQKSYQ